MLLQCIISMRWQCVRQISGLQTLLLAPQQIYTGLPRLQHTITDSMHAGQAVSMGLHCAAWPSTAAVSIGSLTWCSRLTSQQLYQQQHAYSSHAGAQQAEPTLQRQQRQQQRGPKRSGKAAKPAQQQAVKQQQQQEQGHQQQQQETPSTDRSKCTSSWLTPSVPLPSQRQLAEQQQHQQKLQQRLQQQQQQHQQETLQWKSQQEQRQGQGPPKQPWQRSQMPREQRHQPNQVAPQSTGQLKQQLVRQQQLQQLQQQLQQQRAAAPSQQQQQQKPPAPRPSPQLLVDVTKTRSLAEQMTALPQPVQLPSTAPTTLLRVWRVYAQFGFKHSWLFSQIVRHMSLDALLQLSTEQVAAVAQLAMDTEAMEPALAVSLLRWLDYRGSTISSAPAQTTAIVWALSHMALNTNTRGKALKKWSTYNVAWLQAHLDVLLTARAASSDVVPTANSDSQDGVSKTSAATQIQPGAQGHQSCTSSSSSATGSGEEHRSSGCITAGPSQDAPAPLVDSKSMANGDTPAAHTSSHTSSSSSNTGGGGANKSSSCDDGRRSAPWPVAAQQQLTRCVAAAANLLHGQRHGLVTMDLELRNGLAKVVDLGDQLLACINHALSDEHLTRLQQAVTHGQRALSSEEFVAEPPA